MLQDELPRLPSALRHAIGKNDGNDPGPFAPPAGYASFGLFERKVLVRIRIDPDGTIDVFRWPQEGGPSSTQYRL